jgi:3'-phosphoadenosine 5'-phosphosulfate sulfotransferase (PAPS reductase)/FAD synthetase
MATRRICESGVRPVLLFSDTGEEHSSTYKFVEDAARFLDCELVVVRADFTFDEMIIRNNALPSDRMPFCSRELKVAPAKKWLAAHTEIDTLVVGLDWTEPHRVPKVQRRWPNYTILTPMIEPPYMTKTQMLAQIEADGLRVPDLYGMGFQHNNCGGGCVRGGLKAWRHLHNMIPEAYEKWAKREELIPGYSFARDRRGGKTKPYTLRQIAADKSADTELDWGGCGCFIDEGAENEKEENSRQG